MSSLNKFIANTTYIHTNVRSNLGPDGNWICYNKLEKLGQIFTLTITIIVQSCANQPKQFVNIDLRYNWKKKN